MKSILSTIVLLLVLSSCKDSTDLTINRTGTYLATGVYTNYNKAVISAVDTKTLDIQLQNGAGETYVEFPSAVLSTADKFSIDEDVTIRNLSGTYHASGSGTYVDNSVSFTVVAKNKADTTQTFSIPFAGSR